MTFPKIHPSVFVRRGGLIGCLVLAGLLTGCAVRTTRETVPMTLAPYVYKPLEVPAKASLEVAPVKDSRAIGDELALDSKEEYSPYGTIYLNIYVTKKPFAEIFHDALNASLQRNGFETTNGTPYVLQSEITNMNYEVTQTTSTAGIFAATFDEIHSTISVNFELKDKTTGQSVWKQTCNGEDKTSPASVDGRFLAQSYSRAAEDVIRWLVIDPKLRSFFKTSGTNSP